VTPRISQKAAVGVVFVAAMFMSILDRSTPGFNITKAQVRR